MKYTITTTNDNRIKKGVNKGAQARDAKHNMRDPEAVKQANLADTLRGKAPHIDNSRSHLNEYFNRSENAEIEAYREILGASIERYNESQRRKGHSERQTTVEKEFEKIAADKKRDTSYEIIIQVGDKDNHPDDDTSVAILKEFVAEWARRYPNLKIYRWSLHRDEEGATHMHVEYIAYYDANLRAARNRKSSVRGTDVAIGLTGALEELGFTNAYYQAPVQVLDSHGAPVYNENGEPVVEFQRVMNRADGAKAQWRDDFNQMMEDICVSHGLEVIHPMKGLGKSHMDKDEYVESQKYKEKYQAEIRSLQGRVAELDDFAEQVQQGAEEVLSRFESYQDKVKINGEKVMRTFYEVPEEDLRALARSAAGSKRLAEREAELARREEDLSVREEEVEREYSIASTKKSEAMAMKRSLSAKDNQLNKQVQEKVVEIVDNIIQRLAILFPAPVAEKLRSVWESFREAIFKHGIEKVKDFEIDEHGRVCNRESEQRFDF